MNHVRETPNFDLQTFRTQNVGASDHDVQKFFAQPNTAQLVSPSEIPAFDVSAMRAALPPQQHTPTLAVSSASSAPWAADFMMQQQPSVSRTSTGIVPQQQQLQHSEQLQPMHGPVQPQSMFLAGTRRSLNAHNRQVLSPGIRRRLRFE